MQHDLNALTFHQLCPAFYQAKATGAPLEKESESR